MPRQAIANPKVQLPRKDDLLNLFHDRLAVFDRAAKLPFRQIVNVLLHHELLAIFIPNPGSTASNVMRQCMCVSKRGASAFRIMAILHGTALLSAYGLSLPEVE
jgi:hypothetical protein